LINYEEQKENYFLRSGELIPKNKVYRLFIFGWRTLYKWKFSFNHFSAYADGYSIVNEQTSSTQNYWTRTVLGFIYKGVKEYEFNINPEIEFQVQTSGELKNSWVNPIIAMGVRHNGDAWEYSLEYRRNVNKTDVANLTQNILNFSIGFKKLKPFKINIEGNNIFNIGSNFSLTSIVNPTFTNTILSSRIPGSILLVGRYDF
jgi:hypothetical protein